MMWFILLPWMDNGIRTLIGTPRGFLCRRWLLRWIKEEPCAARDCSIKRSDERKKLMVTKVEIRMCRGCDSLVSLQREIEKKDLCNTPTPVTGSRYLLHLQKKEKEPFFCLCGSSHCTQNRHLPAISRGAQRHCGTIARLWLPGWRPTNSQQVLQNVGLWADACMSAIDAFRYPTTMTKQRCNRGFRERHQGAAVVSHDILLAGGAASKSHFIVWGLFSSKPPGASAM